MECLVVILIPNDDFTSFDGDKFWKAIKEKDYSLLISDFVCTIRSDPTFKKNEIPKILRIFNEQVPEIFNNEYHKEDYEEEIPRDKWDETYFYKNLQRLQRNFCKKRISYLKDIGRVVFGNSNVTKNK